MAGEVKMKQYHRVYARISLENIRYNLESIRSKSGSNVMVMPVIKADGYGHGAVETARSIES